MDRPSERDALLLRGSRGGSDTLWIPVTIHLPLGLAKSWTPTCAEFSLYTPLLLVIFFAQLANTVLVPVLPFMVTNMGASPIYYGVLQSSYWVVEMVAAPLLGSVSDLYGRRLVIVASLVISSLSHAVLAMSPSIAWMFVARVLCGCGFQLALCRAYFAETGPKSSRASSFGLIGVITGLALTAGPTLGGIVGRHGKPHNSAWFACLLSALASICALRWRPAEPVEKSLDRDQRKWVRIELGERAGTAKGNGEGAALVSRANGADDDGFDSAGEEAGDDEGAPGTRKPPALLRRSRWLCKAWRLNIWLLEQGVYPLLLLNLAFRFAFSIYKSSFAFFCKHTFGWGSEEVGVSLSLMGGLGILVQGVLLRAVVRFAQDGNTLYIGVLCTALGMTMLAVAQGLPLFVCSLVLITVGYGLAVPSLSALFSHVPMQQGVMQGIAGSADRFGQAIGPLAGLRLFSVLGERGLMQYTGIALFFVCTCCVQFIKGSDGRAISTALARGLWNVIRALKVVLGAARYEPAPRSSDPPTPAPEELHHATSMMDMASVGRGDAAAELAQARCVSPNRRRPIVGIKNGVVLGISQSPFNTSIAEEIRILRERSHSF